MNIEIITMENSDGSMTDYVVIDRGNDEFTSMLKSVWDELNADTEGTR